MAVRNTDRRNTIFNTNISSKISIEVINVHKIILTNNFSKAWTKSKINVKCCASNKWWKIVRRFSEFICGVSRYHLPILWDSKPVKSPRKLMEKIWNRRVHGIFFPMPLMTNWPSFVLTVSLCILYYHFKRFYSVLIDMKQLVS